MKTWKIGVLLLLFVVLLSGCNDREQADSAQVDHQAVKKQVDIGTPQESDEGEMETPEQEADASHKVEDTVMPEDIEFANQVYSNKPPFYYDYYEEVDESAYGNYVLALMDRDGHKVWEAKWLNLALTELALGWEPIKQGNTIYIGVYGDLYALNAKDGSLIWRAEGTGSTVKPVVKGNQIFMAGYYWPLLSAVDKKTGKVLWRIEDMTDYSSTYKLVATGDEIQVICEKFSGDETTSAILKFDKNGTLLNTDTYTGDLWMPQYWNEVRASSTLEAGSGKYEAQNIWDQNFETAWVEGASGYGLTEWVEMRSLNPNTIEYVSIANGYQKSEETYNQNGKLAKYRIDFSSGEYYVAEAFYVDQMFSEEHIQLINPIEATSIKLTILDAAPGTTYEDLCITEWMTR